MNIIFTLILVSILFVSVKSTNVPFIHGGLPAEPGQFPYFASLTEKNDHYCGGSILNSHWVITAEHCVTRERIKTTTVLVGSVIRNEGTPYKAIKCELSSEPVQHFYDLALVKVESEIEFNDLVQPIKFSGTFLPANVPAVTCGFGRTKQGPESNSKHLMYINVTTILNKDCEAFYKSNKYNRGALFFEVCAISPIGVGTCKGDSGGPLVADGELVGVTSFGVSAYCAIGDPSGYARISFHKEWIENIINEE